MREVLMLLTEVVNGTGTGTQIEKTGQINFYFRTAKKGFIEQPISYVVDGKKKNFTAEEHKAMFDNNVKVLNELEDNYTLSRLDNYKRQCDSEVLYNTDTNTTYEQEFYRNMNRKIAQSVYDNDNFVKLYASSPQQVEFFNMENFKFNDTDLDELDEEELEILKDSNIIRKCAGYDEYYFKDDMQFINDDYYSNDFLDNHWYCDHCHTWHSNKECSNTVIVDSDGSTEGWCEECLGEDARWLDSCDKFVSYDEIVNVHDDYDDYYSTFETSRYDANSDYYYDEEHDEYWTRDCWDFDCDMPIYYVDEEEEDEEEDDSYDSNGDLVVMSYHHTTNDLHFFGNDDFFFGTELEICRDKNSVNETAFLKALTPFMKDKNGYYHVECKTDSSIDNDYGRGVEIVTMPHTYNEFWNMKDNWSAMLKLAKQYGYVSHNRNLCGLHTHISRTCFGSDSEEQRKNIAKLIYFFSEYQDDITTFSRRKEDAIEDWCQFYYCDDYNDALSIYDNNNLYGNRYRAVNITNRNTVEVRIMRGTLKESTFFASIDFVMALSKNARNISEDELTDVNKWLKGIKPETLQYIRSKNIFKNLRDEVIA